MNRQQYSLTRKAVKKFREEAINGPEKLFKQCTSFALVGEEGVFLNPQTNCFASLSGYYKDKGSGVARGFLENSPKEPFALLVGLNLEYPGYRSKRSDVKITDEESVRYLDWLMNRSPWSSAFVSKAARSSYKQRVVVLSTTVAGNLMGGAGVAVRRLWEMCTILRVWLDLTARGVPESLAYYLASCADCSYEKAVSWNLAWEPAHHNLDTSEMTKEDVVRFIKAKPLEVHRPYAKGGRYDGYSRMYSSRRPPFSQWIEKEFPKKPMADEAKVIEVVAKPNPFAKAKVAAGVQEREGVDWYVALDNMGLWWPEIYKELGIKL